MSDQKQLPQMEKVTIHRALSELKLIGAKIEKSITEVVPSGITQKNKLVNGVYQKEEFEKTAKAKFQSVIDMITRRNKIKSAIVKANGVTEVTIAGEKMTISDAIQLKTVIGYQKSLIINLKTKHNAAKAQMEKNNTQIDNNGLELAKVALSKEGVKIGDDDVKKVVGPYLEDNRFSLVDPIGVDQKVEEMEKKVIDFEAEVDAVLSEINAITLIEI